MSSVKLTYKQEELVHESVLQCGFKKFKVDANVGTFKGDNYLGVITTITVRETDSGRVLYLILKSAHTNENFRKVAPLAKAFAREAHLYNTIFPRLAKLQNDKGISEPFTGVAKFYSCILEEANESILMGDLKVNGYKLWDRKIPMNDKHVTLVFSEYARFHAASMALKQLHPEEFIESTKDIQLDIFDSGGTNTEEFKRFMDLYFTSGLSGAEGNIKVTEALKRLRNSIKERFEGLKNEDGRCKVILHGDCWCNNMLFQYGDDSSTPKKVCFIDWQLSKLGSPVLDLAYFFCVCSSKEVIYDLPRYLKIYHDVLSKNLKEFGCNPDAVFSFDTLMEHWKRYSWYGVFMSMFIIKLMMSDSSEAPDISSLTDEGKNIAESLEFNVAKSSEFKQRLCNIVEYMDDNDYIH